jgi:cell division protein FtsW
MSTSRAAAPLSFAPDTTLALLGLALLLVGLVAISSASIEYADWHYQNPWFHTQRHLMYLVIAITSGVVVYRVPPQFWLDTGWA